MLLVAGDITRRTGGNLYDRRVARACARAGVRLRIVSVRSTAEAVSQLARLRPRLIVIDSIAIALAAPLVRWAQEDLGARVIALMHMPTDAGGTRHLLRRADRIVTVSRDLARAVARAGVPRSRVTVIPPGCDGVAVIRHRARPRGVLRVLSVANWSPPKGIAALVAAAAQVPEVRLDLVGDPGVGAYRDAVLARIGSRALRGRVTVHGVLGERQLAVRYASADIFALPTEREGYGTVFAEALTHGLPVIAADIAAMREVVGDAGVFVPPRRVRPLARALRLMTDDWLRSRLARAARVRSNALPRWAVSERAFVALVRSEMRDAAAWS